MARRRLTRVLAPAVALLLAGPQAGGQPRLPETPARVVLVLPACEAGPFDTEAFVRLVTIELHAQGVRDIALAPPGPGPVSDGAFARVILSATPCEADGREVEVTIDDAATARTVRRTIALLDLPRDSRPRALALAVAELSARTGPSSRFWVFPHRRWHFPGIRPESGGASRSSHLSFSAFASAFARACRCGRYGRHLSVIGDSALPYLCDGDVWAAQCAHLGSVVGRCLAAPGRYPCRDRRVVRPGRRNLAGEVDGGAALMAARRTDAVDVAIGPHLGLGWAWARGLRAPPSATVTQSGGGVLAGP